jgi:hypothetical protein
MCNAEFALTKKKFLISPQNKKNPFPQKIQIWGFAANDRKKQTNKKNPQNNAKNQRPIMINQQK